MKIDIHSHVIPDRIVSAIAADPSASARVSKAKGLRARSFTTRAMSHPLFEEFRQTDAKLAASGPQGHRHLRDLAGAADVLLLGRCRSGARSRRPGQ